MGGSRFHHCDKASESFKGIEARHPPEHRAEGCDVVSGKEFCPRGRDDVGEIAVAGYEE